MDVLSPVFVSFFFGFGFLDAVESKDFLFSRKFSLCKQFLEEGC